MPTRIVAIALLSVAYLALSQWLMTSAPNSPWNAAALLAPMLALAAAGAWSAGQRMRSALAVAAIVALCLQAMLGVLIPAPWLYLGQHVGINLVLAAWFGSGLRAGHEALITRLARLVHTTISAPMVTYTRNVTRAWVVYFIAMALVSLFVFAFASFEAWAWFANFATPIAIAAMFGLERLIRYRLHPDFERSSISDAIRAYRETYATAGGSAPAPREPRP